MSGLPQGTPQARVLCCGCAIFWVFGVLLRPNVWKERGLQMGKQGSAGRLSQARTPQSTSHFCVHFIDENLVTRPCPTAREAGKCGLAVTLGGNTARWQFLPWHSVLGSDLVCPELDSKVLLMRGFFSAPSALVFHLPTWVLLLAQTPSGHLFPNSLLLAFGWA